MVFQVHMGNITPLPACLSFFHRLIQALRFYWDQQADNNAAVHSKGTGWIDWLMVVVV